MKVDPYLIHRLFYPQVPLVMAAQYRGRVSAMPVVSYLSVSDSPPVVGVACAPQGFTCRLALKARAFTLSVLDRSQEKAISRLATLSGAKAKDKLKEAGLDHVTGKKVRAPVLAASLATLECALKSTRKMGDHLMLFGEVEDALASDSFTDFWDYGRYRPLLYTGWKEGLTLFEP